jgi:hypothetical protein
MPVPLLVTLALARTPANRDSRYPKNGSRYRSKGDVPAPPFATLDVLGKDQRLADQRMVS